jgi:drug/metabolite transporter (DMT)-like permease
MSVPAAYIGVIIIWSTTPLAIQWSSESVGFLFGVVLRMLIGLTLAGLLLMLTQRRWSWSSQAVRAYFAVALGIYGAMISVYWGAQYIPSGLISVLFGLTPIVTGIMAMVLLGERSLNVFKLSGVLVAIGGLTLIFSADLVLGDQAYLGIVAVLCSVVIHSLSAILIKKIDAQVTALELTTGGLLFSVGAYLVTWFLSGNGWPEQIPLRAMGSIVYLGVFGSVLGFFMYFYALKRLSAVTIALVTLITPVIALLLGFVVNGERLSAEVLAGSGLVLLGLLIYQNLLIRVKAP